MAYLKEGISVGIPALGVSLDLIRAINLALQLKNVAEILVSINPQKYESNLTDLPSSERVKYFYQPRDLGLYGNFRFLVKNASFTHFLWICLDDTPTPDLEKMYNLARSTESVLVIPTWVRQEYYPEALGHKGIQEVGLLPNLSTPKDVVLNSFNLDPSWIFGLWNSEFLLKVFPHRHFDGLDCIVLQRAFLSMKVVIYETRDPLIIGTWKWASKVPYRVNGKYFQPNGAIIYQLICTPSFAKHGPRPFIRSLLRILTLRRQFSELNKMLGR